MLRVLLAGGGTAGHINPALAIASIIKDYHSDAEFLFAGTPNGMESRLIPKAGYDFAPIKVSGFQRKITPKNIMRNAKTIAYLTTAGHRAKQIIDGFKPDIVIGTGGYVSGPVVLKAAQMGIKTAIHEQNAFPGMTTKMLSKRVSSVMLTVEEAMEYLDKDIPYTVTGLPVRKGFSSVSRADAKRELGIPENEICILSTGGSLGAGRINETVAELMEWEVKNNIPVTHIHSYGGMGRETFLPSLAEKGVDYENNPRIRPSEYIDNMPVCMAAADLVISRSGANALSELEAMGRASILIPSPNVAGNHQYYNAMVLGKAGAAIVIEEKNLTGQVLIDNVSDLYRDGERLNRFAQRAASLYVSDTPERIYNVISGLIGGK
ncbi:MAG: undecaprenyldiphospho-muramoylpentapeptide beta-N-acetylglucosaminyltransferase [Oscillospiraceae bacterium]|nr:undecaprenyldiphospho-muramoylpentapeptide beta-N-acetylglucosaminyltransferase [Oscillospiraceae bacterium]